jgi:hypothetical protein
MLYVLSSSSNTINREVVGEWAPASVASRQGVLFFISLAFIGALALRSKSRFSTAEWLTLAGFAWLAASMGRAIVWWGIVSAPVVARLVAGMFPERHAPEQRERELPVLNGLIAAVLGAMLMLSLPWFKQWNPLLPDTLRGVVRAEMPVAVADFLQEQSYPGLMFNNGDWGGYFDWALWRKHKPFLDGRVELYPLALWSDYVSITLPAADWRDLLDRYSIGYLVLSTEQNAELIEVVGRDAEWRRTYEDGQAVVFVRAPWSDSP